MNRRKTGPVVPVATFPEPAVIDMGPGLTIEGPDRRVNSPTKEEEFGKVVNAYDFQAQKPVLTSS